MAPITGKCILVSEVSDHVFRDKVLGDGVAIMPTESSVYAPCNGTIVQVAHTNHAICIESDDGLDILLHLGMDTVKLGGAGFTCHVEAGERVLTGQLLMEMDMEQIASKGFDITSPCIITNLEQITALECLPGDVIHAETPIMKYKTKKR